MAQRLREPAVLPKDPNSMHTQEKSRGLGQFSGRALAYHQKAWVQSLTLTKLKESKAGLYMKGRYPLRVGP